MKEIPLTQGLVAIVDAEDYETLSKYKWHCTNGYATHPNWGYMHRAIMRPAKGLIVDHINGIRTDNRRENLRVVTHKENSQNLKHHRWLAELMKKFYEDQSKIEEWISEPDYSTEPPKPAPKRKAAA